MIELNIRVENPSKELKEALHTLVTKATDEYMWCTEQIVIGGAEIPITLLSYDQTLSSFNRTEHSYSFLGGEE